MQNHKIADMFYDLANLLDIQEAKLSQKIQEIFSTGKLQNSKTSVNKFLNLFVYNVLKIHFPNINFI